MAKKKRRVAKCKKTSKRKTTKNRETDYRYLELIIRTVLKIVVGLWNRGEDG